jgi:Ribbon-helix-helix protein, copG family
VRTTVTLADDVVAAIEQLRKERGLGLSDALNELARAGLTQRTERAQFTQESHPLGLKIDVTNVADALELLEGESAR